MSNDRDNEPFLNRWARQKREAARDPAPAQPEVPETPDADLSLLPAVDELTASSDITGFLQKGVPEALKKLALRRMWALDPSIRDFVEMAENQWDFNAPGGIHGLYQDVVEGTDMSAWLAQATHSVIERPSAEPVGSETGTTATDVATQQTSTSTPAVERAKPSVASGADASPPTSSIRANQPAENAQNSNAAVELQPSQLRPPRGRHGGALPS
jgi:hypothetical protein